MATIAITKYLPFVTSPFVRNAFEFTVTAGATDVAFYENSTPAIIYTPTKTKSNVGGLDYYVADVTEILKAKAGFPPMDVSGSISTGVNATFYVQATGATSKTFQTKIRWFVPYLLKPDWRYPYKNYILKSNFIPDGTLTTYYYDLSIDWRELRVSPWISYLIILG
jgi:hypothetical protein